MIIRLAQLFLLVIPAGDLLLPSPLLFLFVIPAGDLLFPAGPQSQITMRHEFAG